MVTLATSTSNPSALPFSRRDIETNHNLCRRRSSQGGCQSSAKLFSIRPWCLLSLPFRMQALCLCNFRCVRIRCPCKRLASSPMSAGLGSVYFMKSTISQCYSDYHRKPKTDLARSLIFINLNLVRLFLNCAWASFDIRSRSELAVYRSTIH